MRVGSLFTGVGGFDLGLERAGHEVVFMCESDESKRRVLRRHWPDVQISSDVCAVRAEHAGRTQSDRRRNVHGGPSSTAGNEADHIPAVDLICGGFPCQDLSVAGRRAGLAGERSGLFHEAARIAGESLRPGGWLLIENVPGLFSSNGGRDFAVVIRTLGDLGFHDLAWRVLDSRHFGVPQRRRRVFVLARRADGDVARKVLLEPEGGSGDFEAGYEARQDDPRTFGCRVAGTLGKRIQRSHTELDGHGAYVQGVATLTRGYAEQSGQDLMAGNGLVPISFRSTGGSISVDASTESTPTLQVGSGFGIPSPPAIAWDSLNHSASEDVTSTLGTNAGMSTGRTGVIHTTAVRRLTPTECERLQGFPDGWTIPDGLSLREAPIWYELDTPDPAPVDPKPDGPRYAAMGDAVTVPVAEWIGRRLMEFGE